MRFKIRTRVPGNYLEIMRRFDRELFEFLLPKGADVRLVEFGGSKKGAKVHLEFVSPLTATWISDITEDGVSDEEAWFIDQGTTLPFGLKFWKHRHIVRRISDSVSEIVDDIEFRFGNAILTAVLYPFVYLSFLPRRQQYKAYFAE